MSAPPNLAPTLRPSALKHKYIFSPPAITTGHGRRAAAARLCRPGASSDRSRAPPRRSTSASRDLQTRGFRSRLSLGFSSWVAGVPRHADARRPNPRRLRAPAEALLANARRASPPAGRRGRTLSIAAIRHPGTYLLPVVLARFHDSTPGSRSSSNSTPPAARSRPSAHTRSRSPSSAV